MNALLTDTREEENASHLNGSVKFPETQNVYMASYLASEAATIFRLFLIRPDNHMHT